MSDKQIIVPPLRQDVRLIKAHVNVSEPPSWKLFCPVTGKYFLIGQLEFELLKHWHLKHVKVIQNAVKKETGFEVSDEDIFGFIQFLQSNMLITKTDRDRVAEIQQRGLKEQQKRKKTLMRSYLMFKFPLFKPNTFLEATLPYMRFFFSKTFLRIWFFAIILGLLLVLSNLPDFQYSMVQFQSPIGLFYLMLAILLTKFIHELGHAYVSKYYGARVSTIGIAFLILWPVFYTDTTDAWRLADRKQRMLIDAAGLIAELAFTTLLLLLWFFLEPGPLKNASFFIATVSWLLTLLINANPCLRFDGYYLLSDYLDLANLQTVSFELGRWKMRQWLFGFKKTAPFEFSYKRRNFLITYAYATWIYRFFLSFTIAWFIYSVMFKLLGIILWVVIIYQMIVMPIIFEYRYIKESPESIQLNRASIRTLVLLTLLMSILFVPWPIRETVPAILQYQDVVTYHAPAGAQIVSYNVTLNEKIEKGHPLIELSSPQLDFDIDVTKKNIVIKTIEVKQELKDPLLMSPLQAKQKELIKLKRSLKGYRDTKTKLQFNAPFDGQVIFKVNHLKPGDWVRAEQKLVSVANTSNVEIIAIVNENQRERMYLDQPIVFISDTPGIKSLKANIESVDHSSLSTIDIKPLISPFGGDVEAVQYLQDFVPAEAVFRLKAKPLDTISLHQAVRGRVKIAVKPHSIAGAFFRKLISIYNKEIKF